MDTGPDLIVPFTPTSFPDPLVGGTGGIQFGVSRSRDSPDRHSLCVFGGFSVFGFLLVRVPFSLLLTNLLSPPSLILVQSVVRGGDGRSGVVWGVVKNAVCRAGVSFYSLVTYSCVRFRRLFHANIFISCLRRRIVFTSRATSL